ncbi:MAG: hypothetical protein JEZ06_00415 [Anaerolineaceae bacterium]|nr:hypothetical protein [Anaerolineaceae bacterium]
MNQQPSKFSTSNAEGDKPLATIFLLCENVILGIDHKWSIINVFDSINLESVPALSAFQLFFKIDFPIGFHVIKVYGTLENKKKILFQQELVIGMPESQIFNIRIQTEITKFDNHIFSLYVDDKYIAETNLFINKISK